MDRVIKFQFLYKGLPHRAGSDKFCWHKKVYSLEQLMEKRIIELSDVHHICELVAKRQFTGLTDKHGVDIYESDLLSGGENVPERVVVFYNGSFRLADNLNSADQTLVEYTASRLEIIGNIHQHKELLK